MKALPKAKDSEKFLYDPRYVIERGTVEVPVTSVDLVCRERRIENRSPRSRIRLYDNRGSERRCNKREHDEDK